MRQAFLSVVFFELVHPQTLLLKNALSSSSLVKIFSSSDEEEIQQIVSMSSRTVIVSDASDLKSLLAQKGENAGLRSFRKYFLEWEPVSDLPLQMNVSKEGVCTIKTHSIAIPIEKFELYLFGCINVFNKPAFIAPAFSKNQNSKYFFTHFSLVGDHWKMIISTHEREKNISEFLGKDWEKLVTDVLSDTTSYKKPKEEVLIKPFYQFIFPHFVDGKLKKITIAHVAYNDHVQENLLKLYKFLETL